MVRVQCPFCPRRSTHIFEHLATAHNIGSADELALRTEAKEREDENASAFSLLSKTLKEKMEAGKITAEEYRRLIVAWTSAHTSPGENP
jgi:hypothetical protein